jgi:hypothetical protein
VSPQGTRIAYHDSFGIRIRGIDGSNPQFLDLGTLENQGMAVDWQPLPVNSYPRPKSAPSQKISLVTAYERCTTPDRVHGPAARVRLLQRAADHVGRDHGRDR